jgi:hypothetical protein
MGCGASKKKEEPAAQKNPEPAKSDPAKDEPAKAAAEPAKAAESNAACVSTTIYFPHGLPFRPPRPLYHLRPRSDLLHCSITPMAFISLF